MNSLPRFEIYYRDKTDAKEWCKLERLIRGLSSPSAGLCPFIPFKFVRTHALIYCHIIILMTGEYYRKKRKLDRDKNDDCDSKSLESFRSSNKSYLGFALLTLFKENHELYVQLMCAQSGHGLGRLLMQKIQQLCREEYSREIKYVTLSAIPSAINFYRKLGFSHFEPPAQLQEDEKKVTPAAQAVAKYHFESNKEALENPEMKHLVQVLIKNNLTCNKNWRQQKKEDEDNDDDWEASSDGLSMAYKL